MQVPIINDPLSMRFDNYSLEKRTIEGKLDNPAVPEEKKARLTARLKDINTRLIPGLTKALQGGTPKSFI